MAIARRFALPSRVLTVLEGEGLVNDATALILFSFAIAAVTEGKHFLLGGSRRRIPGDRDGRDRLGPVHRLGRPGAAPLGRRPARGNGVRAADALCRLLDAGSAGRLGRAGDRGLRLVRELERPALHFAGHPAARLFRLGPGGLSGRERGLPAHRPAGARGRRHAGPDRMGTPGRRPAPRSVPSSSRCVSSGSIWPTYLPRWLLPSLARSEPSRRAKAPSSSPSPASAAWCRWRRRCPSRWRRTARPFPIAGWCCWRPSR